MTEQTHLALQLLQQFRRRMEQRITSAGQYLLLAKLVREIRAESARRDYEQMEHQSPYEANNRVAMRSLGRWLEHSGGCDE